MRVAISRLIPILVSCVVVAGCMTDTATDPGTGDESAANPGDADGLAGLPPVDPSSMNALASESNRKIAFDFFVQKGLTKRQSAGIVGNLIQESNVIPSAIQFGGGPGRGIAQWSVNGRWNASYHDNVTWYANRHSQSRWSLKLQLEFVWYELDKVGGYGLSELRNSRWIPAATRAFERYYEICGQCDETQRIAYARAVYRAYASSAMTVEDESDVMVDADEQRIDVEP